MKGKDLRHARALEGATNGWFAISAQGSAAATGDVERRAIVHQRYMAAKPRELRRVEGDIGE